MDNCNCEPIYSPVNGVLDNDSGNDTSEIWCFHWNECCYHIQTQLSFWLEGVVLVIFSILGLLMNALCCCVLLSKNMRNTFNLLLIALALFDSGYLFGQILEAFRKAFGLVMFFYFFSFFLILFLFL